MKIFLFLKKKSSEGSDVTPLLRFPTKSFDMAPVRVYLHFSTVTWDKLAEVNKEKQETLKLDFLEEEEKE